jgi:Fur family zinc uptake transcriptional regulator
MTSFSPLSPGFAEAAHDHDACVEAALAAAEETCERRGLRLTALRRRVLRIVWSSHRPVGAYDVLEELNAGGHRALPPTVYRALDFLVSNGLVHRLETLNAFIGCASPTRGHRAQFLICTDCRRVVEFDSPAIDRALAETADDQDFEIEAQAVELSGRCAVCRAEARA